MKKILFLSVLTAALCSLTANEAWSGTAIFTGKRHTATKLVSINAGKKYLLKGEFRASQADELSFGLELFNQKKNPLHTFCFAPVTGSGGKLAKDAAKGDKELLLKTESLDLRCGKFLAPDTRKPQRPTDLIGVKQQKTAGKLLKVILSSPLSKKLKAGTFLQLYSGQKPFSPIWRHPLGTKWQHFEAAIAPEAPYSELHCSWLPGTSFGKFFFRGGKPGTRIAFRNVRLAAVDNQADLAHYNKLLKQQQKEFFIPFPPAKPLSRKNGVTFFDLPTQSFFHRHALRMPVKDFAQIEFMFQANSVGMLAFDLFGYTTGKNAKRFYLRQVAPVKCDGKPNLMCFFRPKGIPENGVITDMEIGWRNPTDTRGTLTGVCIKPQVNLIPRAEKLTENATVELEYLLPGREYKFQGGTGEISWINSEEAKCSTLKLDGDTKFTMPVDAMYGIYKSLSGTPAIREAGSKKMPLTMPTKWIWIQRGVGPEYVRVWFKYDFEVKGEVKDASVFAGADDRLQLWINGTLVNSFANHCTPGRHTITSLLKPGKNAILGKVNNDDTNGGFLAELYYEDEAGSHKLSSSPEWKWCYDANGKPDGKFRKSLYCAKPAVENWRQFFVCRYIGPRSKARLIKCGKNTFTVQGNNLPEQFDNFLPYVLESSSRRRPIMLKTNVIRKDDTLTFTYREPIQVFPEETRLIPDFDRLAIEGLPAVATLKPATVNSGLADCKFMDVGKRSKLIMDGKERDCFFWAPYARFKTKFYGMTEDLSTAASCGFHNYAVTTDFPNFWYEGDVYNFDLLDYKVEQLLNIDPDAVFLLQTGCMMPNHWLAKHPDDTAVRNDGKPVDPAYERQALGSDAWRRDARIPLAKLIEHAANSSYGRRIWGCNVAENRNWEWFWWVGRGTYDYTTGYSKADKADFRRYLKEIYSSDAELSAAWKQPGVTLDTADMPPYSIHRLGTQGALLDMAKSRQLSDWFNFRSDAMAKSLISMCKIVKEETHGRWLTGAYYGYYITQVINNFKRPIHDQGHNGSMAVAESPFVDYVRSPSRYAMRRPGLADGITENRTTYFSRGKQIFLECDHRSCLISDSHGYDLWLGRPVTFRQNCSILNRCFGMMAATGIPYYFYDITNGAYHNPGFEKLIREQIDLWHQLPQVQGLTPARTAVVASPESVACTMRNNGKTSLLDAVSHQVYEGIDHLGIPYDTMETKDLLTGKAGAYQLYVMPHQYHLSEAERTALMRKFEAGKATVIWFYAPGAFRNSQGPNAEWCADFLGIKTQLFTQKVRMQLKLMPGLGGGKHLTDRAISPHFLPVSGFDEVLAVTANNQPVAVKKSINGATHIFCAATDLPHRSWEKVLEIAGVFRYLTTPDACRIGNDLICVHTNTPGSKQLFLPAGTHARSILGPLKGTILKSGQTWQSSILTTYLFLVEKDRPENK